jgi:hypothetical protein
MSHHFTLFSITLIKHSILQNVESELTGPLLSTVQLTLVSNNTARSVAKRHLDDLPQPNFKCCPDNLKKIKK